jgi:hypothetical protein
MIPQAQVEKQTHTQEPCAGPLAGIPNLGFSRRKRLQGSAWRETVTQHLPETWPAARMSLQARIAALDIES